MTTPISIILDVYLPITVYTIKIQGLIVEWDQKLSANKGEEELEMEIVIKFGKQT